MSGFRPLLVLKASQTCGTLSQSSGSAPKPPEAVDGPGFERAGAVSLPGIRLAGVAQILLLTGDWGFQCLSSLPISFRCRPFSGTAAYSYHFESGSLRCLTNDLPACGPTATTLPATAAFSRTHLTDLERQFIERRLSEEQSEFELLSSGTFPLAFKVQNDPAARSTPHGAE